MWGEAMISWDCHCTVRNADDYYGIYDVLEPLLGHEEAADAASWCELASFGETWESADGSVEIELYEPDND